MDEIICELNTWFQVPSFSFEVTILLVIGTDFGSSIDFGHVRHDFIERLKVCFRQFRCPDGIQEFQLTFQTLIRKFLVGELADVGHEFTAVKVGTDNKSVIVGFFRLRAGQI